jgi:hypothetical protein
MGLDRDLTDVEGLSEFLIAEAATNKGEDLEFPGGQGPFGAEPARRCAGLGAISSKDTAGDSGVEPGVALGHSSYGFYQVFTRGIFEYEPDGAGAQAAGEGFVVVEGGQDQELQAALPRVAEAPPKVNKGPFGSSQSRPAHRILKPSLVCRFLSWELSQGGAGWCLDVAQGHGKDWRGQYVLTRVSVSLYLNMFGYDDEELNDILMRLAADRSITTMYTLDSSQAGGIHEKTILASDVGENPAAYNASFVIGKSATNQITHTKGWVADGRVGGEGSTNWSTSGEGTFIVMGHAGGPGYKAQNNTQSIFTSLDDVTRFQAELIAEHNDAKAAGRNLGKVKPNA